MSKNNMLKEYIEDLPGGKELLKDYFYFGFGIAFFIYMLLLFLFNDTINNEINTIVEQDLNIQQQISLNKLKSGLDVLSWLFLIGTLLVGLTLFHSYYTLNRSDKIFRKAVEKGYTPLPIEKSYILNTKVNPDLLKAQKSRTIDFLSKLDERFINKELSDNNYKELKAKYEKQIKDIEKQIVDVELHE